MSEVRSAARAGFAWSAVSFAGTKLLSFAATIVLARLIAPADFGVLAAILAFIAVIELAGNVGLKASVVYEQERGFGPRTDTAFTLNLIAAALLAGLGVAAAPLVADFFRVPEHTDLFRLAACSLLLTGLGNVHDAVLLRDMTFRPRIVAELARTGTRVAVSIALAVAGLAATALVAGLLAGSLVWTIVLWTITRMRPRLAIDRVAAREMLGYSGPAAALEILAVVGNRADVAVIGRVLGERALGLYTVAFRVPELVIESVAWNLSTVAFPALSRQRAVDRAQLGALTLALVRYVALYALPAAAVLTALAPSVVVAAFGREWEDASGVLAAIAVMSAVTALAFPVGDAFKAVGRQGVLVGLNVASLPLLVAAIVLAGPAGIAAVAWARVGARGLLAVAIVVAGSRVLAIPVRAVARAQAPGALAGAGALVPALAAQALLGDSPGLAVAAGAPAAGLGALLALRLGAPSALADARRQLSSLRR